MKDITKRKIILLLSAGFGLAFARTPKQYFKVIDSTNKAFMDVKKKDLVRLVKEFRHERLVEFRENQDGTIKIVLTENGKRKALIYDIDNLQINKPKKWDKKWRMVIFDIPDKKKKAREALRYKLKELGFYQFQKSVFVLPYECENEINFISEVFEVGKHIRIVTAEKITNEAELKLQFELF